MFIDADFDYSAVQHFFDEHMKPFFDDMTIYDEYANNHPVVSNTREIPASARSLTHYVRPASTTGYRKVSVAMNTTYLLARRLLMASNLSSGPA